MCIQKLHDTLKMIYTQVVTSESSSRCYRDQGFINCGPANVPKERKKGRLRVSLIIVHSDETIVRARARKKVIERLFLINVTAVAFKKEYARARLMFVCKLYPGLPSV